MYLFSSWYLEKYFSKLNILYIYLGNLKILL